MFRQLVAKWKTIEEPLQSQGREPVNEEGQENRSDSMIVTEEYGPRDNARVMGDRDCLDASNFCESIPESRSESRSGSRSSGQSLGQVRNVPISSIFLNPFQPRKHFEQESLKELAESITSIGIIQPPVVRQKENGDYELISGERRFKAAQLAGLKIIPVLVQPYEIIQTAEAALIENIQRVDLNPLEIAEGLDRLMIEFSLTQEELSHRMGKKRSTIANYLRLLSLPKPIREAVGACVISMGHAKAILALDHEQDQLALFQKILAQGLNVRETEHSVKSISKIKIRNPTDNVHFKTIEEALQKKLGTKVAVQGNESKGKISIDYYSLDDIDRLLEILGIELGSVQQ